MFQGWTWTKATTTALTTWTIIEPAGGSIVPHRKMIFTSTPTATNTFQFTTYINRNGDVRTTSGTIIDQTGNWLIRIVMGANNGVDRVSETTIVRYFTPDSQANPVRILNTTMNYASDTFVFATEQM